MFPRSSVETSPPRLTSTPWAYGRSQQYWHYGIRVQISPAGSTGTDPLEETSTRLCRCSINAGCGKNRITPPSSQRQRRNVNMTPAAARRVESISSGFQLLGQYIDHLIAVGRSATRTHSTSTNINRDIMSALADHPDAREPGADPTEIETTIDDTEY
jgi:hypothetical protein